MNETILEVFYSDGSKQLIGPFPYEADAIQYFFHLRKQPNSMAISKEIRFLNKPIPS